jgi:hypothetical protein
LIACLQAQVLTKAAAKQLLGGVPHKSRTDSPVIFFGTSEVAWIGYKDVFCWEDGMHQQFHTKGRKNKKFVVALEQVKARRLRRLPVVLGAAGSADQAASSTPVMVHRGHMAQAVFSSVDK